MKLPSVVPVFFICLIVGVVFGVVLVSLLNVYNPYLFDEPVDPSAKGKKGGGDGKGKGKGEGFGKMQPPGSPAKDQLVQLVAKLDQLVSQPPTLALDDKQKLDLLDQLKGVDELNKLSEVQASERVSALVQLLSQDQRDALEKANYVIPGTKQGFGGAAKGGGEMAKHRQHVQSLQKKLSQAKAS